MLTTLTAEVASAVFFCHIRRRKLFYFQENKNISRLALFSHQSFLTLLGFCAIASETDSKQKPTHR